jgi:pyrroline-5-carboxylate reductase
MSNSFKIGFFGAGKMAEGILSAVEDKTSVIMAEKVAERAAELKKKYPVAVTGDLKEVAEKAKIIFLSVKPQDVAAVAAEVKPILKPTQVLVSIVAGKKLSGLRRAFGAKVRMLRVMPNLALRANAGMCAICAASNAKKSDVAAVERILGGAGATAVLKERDFDAVTALSGSGPAYFAYMEEAMAEAGVKLGLKPDVARLLAEQTMYGTAKFLRESGMPLKPFIDGVCTKGGTTAAGMEKLAASDFKDVVAATLAAAAKRSKELAK